MLQRRLQEGTRSIPTEDVVKIEACLSRITEDMKVYLQSKGRYASSSKEAMHTDVEVEPDIDTSHDKEAPAYDDTGGLGRMTNSSSNTYMISGMANMSSKEYQEALQHSITSVQ